MRINANIPSLRLALTRDFVPSKPHDHFFRASLLSRYRAFKGPQNATRPEYQFLSEYYQLHPVVDLEPFIFLNGKHTSMAGLCRPNSVCLVERISSPALLRPFDPVIFRVPTSYRDSMPGTSACLKRLIALPGENFHALMDGTMQVANAQGRWKIAEYRGKPIKQEFLQRLGEDQFAAVGDNPHASWDTRTSTGIFPWEDLVGRVREIHYWSESESYWRAFLSTRGSMWGAFFPSPRPKRILQGPFHTAPYCPYRRELV